MKQDETNATLYIASPEMCEEKKDFALMGQVKVNQRHVQLVAINCRKRADIPSKLRCILAELDRLPEHDAQNRRFLEQSLNNLGSNDERSNDRLLHIMPHPYLSADQLLYIGK